MSDDGSQPNTLRYGATDEAGKINLNTADADVLLALPNMTSGLVDCLMDYIDADSDTRPEGAEQDYYDQLASPYQIANAPLTTLDELLLVKGFTARIVYGEDANLNGLLDPNEDDGDASFPPDNSDGVLDRGLRGVATVVSAEPNVDSSGQPRIDLNSGTLPQNLGLPQQTMTFISTYRADGNTFKDPSELVEMKYTSKAGTTIESGVGAAELPVVMDRLTTAPTGKGKLVKGRVNVNTAPAEVLRVLPGLNASLAQQIVETRGGLDVTTKATTAWLYTQGGLERGCVPSRRPQPDHPQLPVFRPVHRFWRAVRPVPRRRGHH